MATTREWLSTQIDSVTGSPLAKAGKGRFSFAAKAALAKAVEGGMVFDVPEVAVAKPRAERRVISPGMTQTIVRQDVKVEIRDEYDAKDVREWANSVGLRVSARGRVSSDIVAQFNSNNSAKPARVVVAEKPRVRPESVAWGFNRPEEDKPWQSDVLVALSSCGKCSQSIGWCSCSTGPICPQWLNSGEIASLVKP